MVMSLLQNGAPTNPSPEGEWKKLEEYLKGQERPWWFQTAKEIRESDEAKVRDYKEDIDTLLVFGALFSAVITAFLLDSYKNLSPDLQDVSVQILLHVSQQLSSFNTNGGFFNSTIPAFTLPEFTPLKGNLIINATWFASLILSLMAASYGMLVKQWLREFLATQEASPLVRLRIRCFRYPALAKWKVFEIVAALPLLLQLSLGLFFIGLWYFASSIHPVLEWTVGPLVVTWLLLFLAVTLAPIFSANCPYKTTFLKNVMVHLRYGRFLLTTTVPETIRASILSIIFDSNTSHSSGSSQRPVEEDVIVRKDGDDIEVLKQVDLNQVDDALISPALVEIGRQHPGEPLVEVLFSILARRDVLIERDQVNSWKHTGRLSVTLLKSICEALNETLKHEYERLSSLTPTQTSHEWAEWLLTSMQFLIFMSHSAWFTPAFCKTISGCLSITNPDSIDKLLSGWSADEEKMIAKQTIFFIDPSAADLNDFRPLTLHKVSELLWKKSLPLVEQMIFPEDTPSAPDPERNPDNVVGFRMVFGEYQDRSPDVLYTLHQRIRDTVNKDELVKRLLSPLSLLRPLSPRPSSRGDGLKISAYVFRILRTLWPSTELEHITDLSEEGKIVVYSTLIGTLQDESEAGGKQPPAVALEEPFLDAVYTIICMDTVSMMTAELTVLSPFFERHPDAVANGILDRLSKEPTINRNLSTLIPKLFHVFLHTDRTRNDDDEPWKSMKVPAHPAMRNILVNVTARCLASELGETSKDPGSNVSLEFKWGIHLLLSCFENETGFSDSTVGVITQLISPNPHFIIRSIPLEEDEQQIARFWRILGILDTPQRISFITPLWPGRSPGEKLVPFKLLKMHATSLDKNVVEVFLRDTPQDFHTHPPAVIDFIFFLRVCCAQSDGYGDDLEALEHDYLNQANDGPISSMLINFSCKHQGPHLVRLAFSILGRLDALFNQNDVSSWKHTGQVSATLLESICKVFSETLKHEHERLRPLTPTADSHKWEEWLLTPIQFLIFMSQSTWFTHALRKTISDCLSISNPDSIDKLLSGWSADEERMIVKQTIFFIDPSAADTNDFRPLMLHKFSNQSWEKAVPLIEQMIFLEDAVSGTHDSVVGFRMVFGDYQDRNPDVLDTLHQRIRDTVDKNQLVDQLLRPLSLKPSLQGDGRKIAAYVIRILRTLRLTGLEHITDISEESKRVIFHILIDTLQDESEAKGKQPTLPLEDVYLDTIYTIILCEDYVHDEHGIDVLSSFFERHPDAVASGIIDRLSKEPPTNHTLSTLIPKLFRAFLHLDMTRSFDNAPWESTLEIPAHHSMRNILVSVTARCLASELGEADDDTAPNVSLWFKWGIHLLLSCFENETGFSDSTIEAITKLVSPNPRFIIRSIPLEEDERQVERLWRILCILDPPQRISFITPLWPRYFTPGEKRIHFKLLQMHATSLDKNVVEVFLQDTPREFHAHPWVVNDFIFSFQMHHNLNNSSMERCLDELEPFIQIDTAEDTVAQIAVSTTLINDPRWPVWMKEYLTKDIRAFQSTSEMSKTLKRCLYWNATEGIALIASYGVEYLDKLPDDLLAFRELIGMEVKRMFLTFAKHPEPLDPEQAEECLMRMIVHAGIDGLMWTFCTHAHFNEGDPPPRYACVSFLTRILKYYMDPKGVSITRKDIRSPLDLTQLEKEVWNDASAAAAEILSREEFYEIENAYFGGRETWRIARMDAIMILLATSPYPFPTDLCYNVLEQNSFFCWEDNTAIQPGVRLDLEERLQRRMQQGERSGYLVSNAIVEVVDNSGSRIEEIDDGDDKCKDEGEVADTEANSDGAQQIHPQRQVPASEWEQKEQERKRDGTSIAEVDGTGNQNEAFRIDNKDDGHVERLNMGREENAQDSVTEEDTELGETGSQVGLVIGDGDTTLRDM